MTKRKKPSPEYVAWVGMRQRCNNPNSARFKLYGGRGITVCERWSSYDAFLEDMGRRPGKGWSLDRIDVNGNYSPDNCKWSTQTQQLRNIRTTRKVVIKGATYVAADLAEQSGLKTDTIISRASNGLSFDEVVSKKRRIFREGLALGGVANGARQKAKTHCVNGHEYSPENTSISKEGWRRCKACARAKEARRRKAIKDSS